MERLTSYKNECKREMICRYEDCDICEEYCPHINEDNCICLQEILGKLGEYEDLEEKGLLVKLPCKVGDRVYIVGTKCLADIPSDEECEKLNCITCKYENEFVVFEKTVDIEFMITLMFKEDDNFIFGETVFTEKTEAENVLNSK